MGQVIADRNLAEINTPPSEFCDQHAELPRPHWNHPDRLTYLQDLINSLTLPEFDYSDENQDSWEGACEDVWQYVEAVATDSDNSETDLFSR